VSWPGQRTRAYYSFIRIVVASACGMCFVCRPFVVCCCRCCFMAKVVVWAKSIVFTFTCGFMQIVQVKISKCFPLLTPLSLPLTSLSSSQSLNDGSCYVMGLAAVRNRSPGNWDTAVCFTSVCVRWKKLIIINTLSK